MKNAFIRFIEFLWLIVRIPLSIIGYIGATASTVLLMCALVIMAVMSISEGWSGAYHIVSEPLWIFVGGLVGFSVISAIAKIVPEK